MGFFRTALLLSAMTALFGIIGLMIGGGMGMAIALGLAVVMNLWAYWNSDKMVLKAFSAQLVDPTTATGMLKTYADDIISMAKAAHMPVPAIYVIPDKAPNAFATGRDPEHAAVAATHGLLQSLTREEIRAVMAHELAHIKNRDTLIMTVTATLAGAISSLANFAMFFGGSQSDEDGPPNFIVMLLMSILAPMAAMIVQMAISRSREYEADRVGAMIAGDAASLADALHKIDDLAHRRVNHRAEAHPAAAHMFIINPLSGKGMDNLFSTHPATQNRVRALMEIAGRMGTGGPGRGSKTGSGLPQID
jgi:heat shock protein HtpX